MADADLNSLISQLRNLSDDQLQSLQTKIDVLERRSRSSHHETTSHHHTSALLDFDVPGLEAKG